MVKNKKISKAHKSLKIKKKQSVKAVYKKTVLEKYYEKGYLSIKDSPFSDEDRKNVGERLAQDHYLGAIGGMHSVNLENERVQASRDANRENALFYFQRYHDAMLHIPREFQKQVYKVCIMDMELTAEGAVDNSECYNKYNIFHQKMLLALGLERLVRFYLQKK